MKVEEMSPLDVLLMAMRQCWKDEKTDEAVALAKAAAPYVHAKPAGGRGASSKSGMGGNRLDELCAAAFFGVSTEEADTDEP